MTVLLSLLFLLQTPPATAPAPLVIAPAAVASPATTACPIKNREARGNAGKIVRDIGHGDGGEYDIQSSPEVAVYISADGNIDGVTTYVSSGKSAVDQDALRAAAEGTYTPTIKNCAPIKSVLIVTPEFG